jgi:hypothetical protein
MNTNTIPLKEIPSIAEQQQAFIDWREGKIIEFWSQASSRWIEAGPGVMLSKDTIVRPLQPKPKERELIPIDWIRPGCVIRKGAAPMVEYLITEVHRERNTIMIGQATYSSLETLAKEGWEYTPDPTMLEWSSFYKD